MLVTSLEIIHLAQKKKAAIPAINTQGGHLDIIRAICLAAERMRSPVMLAHYPATGQYAGDDFFIDVGTFMAKKVSVPVALHLDHGTLADCQKAVSLGFTSIMFDGSAESTEENAKHTQTVIDLCRPKGIPVEAEIGQLMRTDAQGRQQVQPCSGPEQVKTFLSLCQPDFLAVGIGNAHGFYQEKPNIRIDILKDIQKFSNIPLVLHGCTGMAEDVVKAAIAAGVCKINFGTQVRYQYVAHFEEGLKTLNHQGHAYKLSQFASDKLIEDICAIIRLSGSENLSDR